MPGAGMGPGQQANPLLQGSDDTPVSSMEAFNTRVFLTWPRALLIAAALAIFAGGRGSYLLLVVLGLTLWISAKAVQAGARGLGLSYRLVDDHAFAGTQARIEVALHNRGRWPLPLVLLQARLPEGLHGRLRRVATVGPRGVHRFRFEVVALRRGAYRLGDTRLVLSDWFGLFEERVDVPVAGRLIVYPKLPPVPELEAVRRLPSGPRRDPRSPFRDDLPMGVRPYQPGDPLRAIAWKQSARRGDLVVREYPLVRETVTWIFLDLCAQEWDPHSRHELTEWAIAVAGTLLTEEQAAHRATGFATWGLLSENTIHGAGTPTPASWMRLAPRSGHGQLLRALEVLAAVRPAEGTDFTERLRQEGRHLPWGARVVALVPRDTPELWHLASSWVAHGHPVSLLCFERRLGRPDGVTGANLPHVVEVATRDGVEYR